MRSVRISLKTARALVAELESVDFVTGAGGNAYEELRAAMAPKKSVSASRVRRVAKRVAHNTETSDVREEVFARAAGLCEMCWDARPTDLQHCEGRVKQPQAESNCLAICRPCHRAATKKTPETVRLQAERLDVMGHVRAARDMYNLANWLESKAETRQRMLRHRAAMKDLHGTATRGAP